jgi:hypothetical protein
MGDLCALMRAACCCHTCGPPPLLCHTGRRPWPAPPAPAAAAASAGTTAPLVSEGAGSTLSMPELSASASIANSGTTQMALIALRSTR